MRRALVPVVLAAVAAVAAVGLVGCVPEPAPAPSITTPVEAPTDPSTHPASPDAAPPDTVGCAQAGGTVQERQPTVGVESDDRATWVTLGDPVAVCRFVEGDGDTQTRLYVDPVTLSSHRPTLAAAAYLAKIPAPDGGPRALCDLLGGASAYGTLEAEGGLVDLSDDIDTSVAVCRFADGSFIDIAALAAYSADTALGTDLARLFRFSEDDVPHLFDVAVG